MKQKLADFSQSFNGEFKFDDLHRSIYATDASVYRKMPLAVAFPKNEEGIKQLIDFANREKVSLIPRTAGTSLAGQCVGDGIIVDVSKYFTKIIALDIENRTVTLQPGVIRDELNDFLKPHGLFFGPNTSTSNRCMIGGMVGNNSSGTTSIKYGVTRDKVLKIKALLANGQSVVFGNLNSENFRLKSSMDSLEGNIYKTINDILSNKENQLEIIAEFPKPEIHRRNTGYALDTLIDNEIFTEAVRPFNMCNLLCGSEGTLAFTTEITLKLDLLPPSFSAMVAAHYNDLDICLNDVSVAMRHDLYTCEMMDDVILDCTKQNKKYQPYRFFVEGSPKAILLFELRSHSEEDLEQQISALLLSLEESANAFSLPVLRNDEIEMAVELRKAGLGLLGNMVGDKKAVACIEDTAVALIDLPEYIKEFSSLMKRYDQKAVYYAHAGAGELHLRPILDLKNSKDVAFFRKITTDVAKLVKKYKGSFSGEHGDGIVRAEFLKMQVGEHNYGLMREIKKAFDPNNIFNPGKIVDALKMDENIRYEVDRKEPQIETILNFEDSQGILRLAEKCNGSGDCRKPASAGGTMCPSYQATKNEKDTTRARANMLREVLTNNDAANKFDSKELKEVFDLCISCKACATECPSNVDIATAKAEFLYQYNKENGISLATKLFGKSSSYTKKASRFPRISNAIFGNVFTGSILKKISGIANERSLPRVSINSFSKQYQSFKNQLIVEKKYIKEVYLFVDEFSNYSEAEIAMDAFQLLTHLNYKVNVIDVLDSARALISKGFLEEAKQHANTNISFLKAKITLEKPLLGIEPSAILSFRDEFLRLADDEVPAKAIGENTFLIEEFISSEIKLGNIKADQFTSEAKKIKIHVHCHQKALSDQKVTFDVLNLPKNYNPTLISSGCCGMAGSFGYEKEHYEVSMKIGELRLFPLIRKASSDTIIAANGTSCRHQIKDGTSRKALHPITVLRNALIN